MGWNYLSITKLQRWNRWSLGMEKQFHSTLSRAYDYLSMLGLGLKLNHLSKRGYWRSSLELLFNSLIFIQQLIWQSEIRSFHTQMLDCEISYRLDHMVGHQNSNLNSDCRVTRPIHYVLEWMTYFFISYFSRFSSVLWPWWSPTTHWSVRSPSTPWDS